MTTIYKVTAPYVTLRVRNAAHGTEVVTGFYKDAPVPEGVHPEDLERHLRKGMVEKVDSAEAKADAAELRERGAAGAAERADDLAEEKEGEEDGEEDGGPDRPAVNAPKGDWVAFAVASGADRDEAEASTKAELVAKYGG